VAALELTSHLELGPPESRYGEAELAALADPALAEALERRDLLASHLEDGRLQVHLGHPIYGDVIRSRTPALRARQVALDLAEAVERTGNDLTDNRLRVASWRHLAGEGDPDALFDGAVIARWRYDFDLADTLARAAGGGGAGGPPAPRRRCTPTTTCCSATASNDGRSRTRGP
jgi:hypothetical protein